MKFACVGLLPESTSWLELQCAGGPVLIKKWKVSIVRGIGV
jgi:hypothetical protein